MARQRSRGSWISSLFGITGGKKVLQPRAPRRKLSAEWLENRMVLSTAPLPDVQVLSLDQYIAQEHEMGPIAPAEVAAPDVDANAADSLVASASSNQLLPLAGAQGEGEDCTDPNDPTTCGTGSDGTGGDGTGGDGTGGDGTGGDGTGGDGTGGDGTGGDGTGGDGTGGDGTGGDGTGGDGTGGDGGDGDTSVGSNGDNITFSGSLDSTVVSMTLDNGSGSVQLNDDGTFTVTINDPDGYSSFNVTAIDSAGNATTYTFSM